MSYPDSVVSLAPTVLCRYDTAVVPVHGTGGTAALILPGHVMA